jgi:hypothetical protein
MRKVVTIVFADLVGSTALHERLEPESARRFMESYYVAMRGAVEAQGGTVTQLLGDGVKAVFGIPRVAEDDAIRAVRAAVAMQDAFRALAEAQRGAVGGGESTHRLVATLVTLEFRSPGFCLESGTRAAAASAAPSPSPIDTSLRRTASPSTRWSRHTEPTDSPALRSSSSTISTRRRRASRSWARSGDPRRARDRDDRGLHSTLLMSKVD